MHLIVPFLYEALVIRPRCRKPSLVVVRDAVEVTICEKAAHDLPVAFRITDYKNNVQEIRWDGQRLWDFDYMADSRRKLKKVRASTVVRNTTTEGNPYPFWRSSAQAPFHNFWFLLEDTMCKRHDTRLCGMRNWLTDELPTRDKVKARQWIDDNRQAVIDRAHQLANDLLICNGYMFAPVGEPRYVVATFGLGHNHGGTALMLANAYNPNIPNTAYFRADHFEQAVISATQTATKRGDSNNLPIQPDGKIDVLIPEAVTINPAADHGEGCEFINQCNAIISASSNPMVSASLIVSSISAFKE